MLIGACSEERGWDVGRGGTSHGEGRKKYHSPRRKLGKCTGAREGDGGRN